MDLGIKSLEGIRNSSIDFVAKKLKLEIFESADAAAAIKEVKQIVRNIKPDVKLKEITDRKAWEADSEEKNESGIKRLKPFQFGIGAAFFAAAVLLKLSAGVELAMYLTAYLLVGGEVLVKSIRNIFRGQVFDENFLMSLATIGAFAIGEYSEGVAVMIFYQIGEMFQDLAVDRSRRSIKELMDIRPDYANLVSEGQMIQVPPEDVPVGAYIIVKPGERVPLDGRITEGRSMLDTSALTGESVPREANAGDEILAGFINNSGVLTVEVSKEFGESTVSKILDMVENASNKKSHTENFITRFARYYTPTGRSIQSPYNEGYDKYMSAFYKRYSDGEMISADSIHMPDSLKFRTLVNGRTVYGGGGIMPDVFMAADTANYSDYYRSLVRRDVFRSFVLEYTDRNRAKITSRYTSFDEFKEGFQFTSAEVNEFIKKGEELGVKYVENQFNRSKEEMLLILKALVASNIWQVNEYYRIINEKDPVIDKALEVISDAGTYNRILRNRSGELAEGTL